MGKKLDNEIAVGTNFNLAQTYLTFVTKDLPEQEARAYCRQAIAIFEYQSDLIEHYKKKCNLNEADIPKEAKPALEFIIKAGIDTINAMRDEVNQIELGESGFENMIHFAEFPSRGYKRMPHHYSADDPKGDEYEALAIFEQND